MVLLRVGKFIVSIAVKEPDQILGLIKSHIEPFIVIQKAQHLLCGDVVIMESIQPLEGCVGLKGGRLGKSLPDNLDLLLSSGNVQEEGLEEPLSFECQHFIFNKLLFLIFNNGV